MSEAWCGLQRGYLTFDEVIALGTKLAKSRLYAACRDGMVVQWSSGYSHLLRTCCYRAFKM